MTSDGIPSIPKILLISSILGDDLAIRAHDDERWDTLDSQDIAELVLPCPVRIIEGKPRHLLEVLVE